MAFSSASTVISSFSRATRSAFWTYTALRMQATVIFGIMVALQRHSRRSDVYNILWAVVFGFATLNILSLTARRFEPTRRDLSFGEVMAVVVVVLSVFLLGWEMLNLFHIFPIKLRR